MSDAQKHHDHGKHEQHDHHGQHHHNSHHHSHHHHGHGHEAEDLTKFNPRRVYEAFQKSAIKNENGDVVDVDLKEYINGYDEIIKFFGNLGKVFYFVEKDARDKFVILGEYQKKDPVHYETILKTVDYEKKTNFYAENKGTNGSRHILRLHRALLFIFKFLDRLFKASNDDKTSTMCAEVYDKTLAKHHAWIVRNAAKLGMYTLPRRDDLVNQMCHTDEEKEKFPLFIDAAEAVYNATQRIYEKYEFLDLP